MRCPHCNVECHFDWSVGIIAHRQHGLRVKRMKESCFWAYKTSICPNPECDREIIYLGYKAQRLGEEIFSSHLVHPKSAGRGPVAQEVPEGIARDYIEACDVLPISAKAAAALARRVLQSILHTNGYKARDLAQEIELLLNEQDPKRAIPLRLRETIDGIRNFGNFSAHPINDKTTLQIIDVEPHEAEWCLDIIEEMFEHFYVSPAIARTKKAALDAKLAAAGKPPSK
jgi:hypothetical protein